MVRTILEPWVIVAVAVVAVAVLALVLFPKIRMRLKGPGTQLEVDGDRRRAPPPPGGVDAKRIKTDRDIDARGDSVQLRRGRAGGDINLRAGGSQRVDAQPARPDEAQRPKGPADGGPRAELTHVRARRDVNVTVNEPGHAVAEPSFPLVVGVPDRDPGFVGRDAELDRLRAAWDGAAATPMVVAQATVGLGGVGKSALVTEYAHRMIDEGAVEVVRWFTADRRDPLEGAYIGFAAALGLDVRALQPPEAVARVRGWLETTERSWLVVFDNADDPSVLDGLVPPRGRGQVVITSRHSGWAGRAHVLDLGVLSADEAVAVLCARAGRAADAAAEALVERLGWLALAVVQAGAYTAATGMSFGEYRRMLDERAAALLARNDALAQRFDGDDMVVASVWDASLHQATQESTLARDLLGVVAYLAPDGIPLWLLTGESAAGEPLVGAGDEPAVREAIAALARYSLVEAHRYDHDGVETLSVHRLIGDVTRAGHADHDQSAWWCAAAVRLIAAAMPADGSHPDQWPMWAVLGPHLLAVTAHARSLNCELETVTEMLVRYGTYTRESGDPHASINYLQQACDLAEQLHGPESLDSLAVWHTLATSYGEAGRTDEALPIEQWVAERLKERLGAENAETLAAWNNVATSYKEVGRTDSAISLAEWVAARLDEHLGADHPRTFSVRVNLVSLYEDASRTEDAIRLGEWVTARLEERLGAKDPDTLTAWSNLATSYWKAGRTEDAIPLAEWVADRRQDELGATHPDTLAAWSNLAASYGGAGCTHKALPILQWVVARRQERLGADHPHTILAWGNLAAAYAEAGHIRDAIPIAEWVADRLEGQLGADHPDTLRTLTNLATSYRAVGRTGEAQRIEEWIAKHNG